ncbi:MAG: nitrite/sulfite reductase, partial [Thaumarchaeota archaeon]|nr:nitrite/sulfite reductase [Nitrososphaerota archaeon]
MTISNLKQSRSDSIKPKINWSRVEEADNFAKTVKLFRQGKYDADSFRRFRLQHGAYGTRMTGDYAMVRIKIPAGEIYPRQLEKISQLSEQFSIGSAHFSTRENIQLHWVVLEDVSEIFRGLTEVGLTSREACGNTIRNIMCSPLSGVCPDEKFDSTPYALATARFFLRNPMVQNLPRKFKFNFTCCEKHGMVRMVDVGLIPHTQEVDGTTQRGFKIFLGGGLGNKSFVGYQLEEFTPEEDLVYTSMAVLRIFDRLGDRKNMARNRMRYLVNDMGWEKFQNLVLKERAIVRATQSVITQLEVDHTPNEIKRPIRISDESGGSIPDGYARWLKTNTVKQKQSGYRSIFITLEAGDITANQLNALADLIRDFSSEGKARFGFVQNVALRYVSEDDLPRLYSNLLEVGLAKSGALTMTAPIGCSGTTSCNLALTNSHRLAKEIQRKLLELKFDEDD